MTRKFTAENMYASNSSLPARDGLYPMRESNSSPGWDSPGNAPFTVDTSRETVLYPPPTPQATMAVATPQATVPLATPQAIMPLRILAATWGGVNVSNLVASMASNDEVLINLKTFYILVNPDPAPGIAKMLAVMYEISGQPVPALVLIGETHPTKVFSINNTLLETSLSRVGGMPRGPPYPAVMRLEPRREVTGNGRPQIHAVTYGPKRYTTQAVIDAVTEVLVGNRDQITMGSAFFQEDPSPGYRKEWSVFFSFGQRIQCVTGQENGVLRHPWASY